MMLPMERREASTARLDHPNVALCLLLLWPFYSLSPVLALFQETRFLSYSFFSNERILGMLFNTQLRSLPR